MIDIKVLLCNNCGKDIVVEDGYPRQDYLHVIKEWGYHSGKDGEIHSFHLCEDCYDRITGAFAVPINKSEKVELL